MKKAALILLFCLGLMSFSHKFYVSIFQVNHVPEKKMLQVTSRIFVDDLCNALEKKYRRKFHLGTPSQTAEEVALMQQYMSGKLLVEVNGKPQPLEYLSNEMENEVFICYFRAKGIEKITSIKVTAKVLFEFVTEQQNIIQTNINGKKNSLLLTDGNPEQTITYSP